MPSWSTILSNTLFYNCIRTHCIVIVTSLELNAFYIRFDALFLSHLVVFKFIKLYCFIKLYNWSFLDPIGYDRSRANINDTYFFK
jgi:hypothetical protein